MVAEKLVTEKKIITCGQLFLYDDASDWLSLFLRFVLPHGASSYTLSLIEIDPAVAEKTMIN